MEKRKKISSPDKLNEYLKATSALTWILLGIVIVALLAIFIWSHIANITYKIEGSGSMSNGVFTIDIDESRLEELKVGQVIYISNKEGEIIEIDDNGRPVISKIDLEDGTYEYTIIIKTIHPIEYLLNR